MLETFLFQQLSGELKNELREDCDAHGDRTEKGTRFSCLVCVLVGKNEIRAKGRASNAPNNGFFMSFYPISCVSSIK